MGWNRLEWPKLSAETKFEQFPLRTVTEWIRYKWVYRLCPNPSARTESKKANCVTDATSDGGSHA